jgi:CTP:molybdopterin cytidylyltransferase MocA
MTDPVADPCVVVAVPARLASARLPGKVLADIGGKPMLQHVLERCRQARGVAAVVVCTDSDQVRSDAEAWGFPVLMTSPQCSSGSERLASVVAELVAAAGGLPADTLVINVQGDQPLLDPGIIEAMVAHELGHCWRHARGDWHAWPAGFDAPRPSSPTAVHAASQRAAHPDRVEAARREEGFADLVALAWTLQRDPAAYAFVHGWLTAQRADPAHDGAEHDTRAWVRAACDPAAFGPPGPLFERARRLWAEVDPAQAH